MFYNIFKYIKKLSITRNLVSTYVLLLFLECFIDCGFFMLKIAGENLHLYMMDL